MASKGLTLVVRPRGKPINNLPEETAIVPSGSGADLYHRLAAESGLSIHRLRITKGSDGGLVPSSKDVTMDRLGLREQSTIYVKDLGPQIAWRTVFIVEYLGPLLIHPILYLLRPYIYSNPNAILSFPPPSQLQTLSLIMITLHFAKRELETLFVHRFSLATMPARNIFKNSFHYWIFAGINIAYWIYRPDAPTAKPSNPLITYPALLLYVIGELGNLSTHLTLRNLRSTGGSERGIPQGFGFGLVTSPNYMFETITWIGIWLVTWSWSTLIFNVLAVGQMMAWAKKKEGKYRKEFGDQYKKKTYSMLPGI
ncbi:MAG: 3-oxo-5a-steroid 4- dehydrogenase, partial [Pleopsidium flavum]